MFSKVKNLFTGLKSKTKTVALTASATAVTSSVGMIAMAATSGNSNTKKIIGNVLGYVMAIFRYIGYVLAAWGVGQLVLAFKNDDADSKSRAIMTIVAAVALVGIGVLMKLIIGDNGITSYMDNAADQL